MSEKKLPFQYDDLSEKSIRNYFDQVQKLEVILKEKIDNLLQMHKQVYIFGCGAYAMSIIKRYQALLEKIECFIDNNTAKQGQYICGKKVLPASEIKNTEDVVVVICSMLNAKDLEEQVTKLVPKCSKVIL
ncbi:MAG: hypothetical protein K2G55_16635 [Lachnospiraceae bacterium]|nr:hypothetical protein [Lachnospiraceae bacterium]